MLSLILASCSGESELASGEMQQRPQDPGSEMLHKFSCTDGPDFRFRFLGPETILVVIGDRDYVLQRERTASGARYTGNGVSVWNKGAEAMLGVPDGNYRCMRVTPQE